MPANSQGPQHASGGGGGGRSGSQPRGAQAQQQSSQGQGAQGEALYHFLLSCKVDKGSEYTHTSFQRPVGAFYIPASQTARFYQLYENAVARGEDLYITEKHRHISPLLVDVDLRVRRLPADGDGGGGDGEAGPATASTSSAVTPSASTSTSTSRTQRLYHSDHVDGIVSAYAEALQRMVELPASVDFYVLEKDAPPAAPPTQPVLKDGVHVIAPDVVLRSSAQYLLRREVLPALGRALSDAGDGRGLAAPIEDVIDEAVIQRNNWLMYGSKKPHQGSRYALTRVVRYDRDSGSLRRLERAEMGLSEAQLVQLLSIRNKYDETPILEARMAEVTAEQSDLDERERRRTTERQVLSATPDTRENRCESLETVAKLVGLLAPSRADSYASWIRVGWCLRNVDHRLLEAWVAFSKRSGGKYRDGECERLWHSMRAGGLGIGTLHMWAKHDAPDEYRMLVRRDLENLIARCTTGAHNDVARVLYHMYRYDYVCASIRNKCWYEFRDHRWRPSDCAYTLRKKISNELVREFIAVSNQYLQLSHLQGSDGPHHDPAAEAEANRLIDVAHKLTSISVRLRTTTFKENVMKECCELFYHEKFEEKLDSFCHLIGFENGVYDLEAMEFREGRPDDFVSFTTGVRYEPWREDDERVRDVQDFLEKVLPNKDVREYVLRVLARSLNGHVREERFHVWTGSGSNGKSKTVELFEKAFGDYCCKFPVTLLTQKRAASNAANSEVARAKGKRFGVLQEPSEDEKLNIGLMKELTGGDKIMTRKLYSEPQEWKPQWTLVLLCNHLPNVPSDDGGTWRRIRVVEFNSRFVENPHPDRPNEFAADPELSKKFDSWKEPFMSMLIEVYRVSGHQRLVEPEEVTACTREYQKNNDHMADFVDTCLIREEGSVVSVMDAFQELKDWIREDNIPIRAPKRKDLQVYLDKNIGRATAMHGPSGGGPLSYKNYRLRDRHSEAPMGAIALTTASSMAPMGASSGSRDPLEDL